MKPSSQVEVRGQTREAIQKQLSLAQVISGSDIATLCSPRPIKLMFTQVRTGQSRATANETETSGVRVPEAKLVFIGHVTLGSSLYLPLNSFSHL